ncbi:MAG TPA: hypothetical protein VNC78_02240 [Actinomycetota bacterium]|nr:hypothetical protein [Actinomycetota bacterium]
MEMNGHPTQDILDELVKRGAVRMPGDETGSWLFLPDEIFMTGMDDPPPAPR